MRIQDGLSEGGSGWARRGFGGSVTVLASGTVAGQALGVLASPVLSRLYSPEAFGAFGVLLAIVSLAGVGLSLRYDAAIPLPEDEPSAQALLVLALGLAAGFGLAGGIVAFLVGSAIGALPLALLLTLALAPPALMLTGVQQALTFWATRTEAFAANARATVAQSAIQTAAQLGLGVAGAGAFGLGVGYVLGRAAGGMVLFAALGSGARAGLRSVTRQRIRVAARDYRRFPLVALWSALVNAGSLQGPVLTMAWLFSIEVVGWFLLTMRVLQLPLSVIGSAVGQVFYARASRAQGDELASTTRSAFRSLAVLGVGPMLLLAVGGERGFGLVFGDAWRDAGSYAQVLAPWLLLVFVTSPLSTLVYVLSRQREELAFQVALLVVRVGALVAGWQLSAANLAVGLFGLGSAVLWAIYLGWLLRITGVGVRAAVDVLGRELAIGVLLVIPVAAGVALDVGDLVWATISAVVLAVMLLRSASALRRSPS